MIHSEHLLNSKMSGLINEDTKSSLVLRSSSLFVNINGFVASTLARLCYFNQFNREVEAVFVYNDNETFITDFRATIGQRKIHKEVREMMSEKDVKESCFSIQESMEKDFLINIGKIPPKALVLLEVDVLGELETTDNGQALVFKTPQIFTPFCGEFNENGEDICSTTQAYKFDIKIRTDMHCQLAGCHSLSHAIQVDADANASSAETIIITLAEDFKYDREIKVCFYPANPLDVYTSIEPGLGSLKEINCSPKSTSRRSTPSANLQTFTDPNRDFLKNTILRKESQNETFSESAILNPKSNETQKDLSRRNSIKHEHFTEFTNDNTTEKVFHKTCKDFLSYGSEKKSEHVLEDKFCLIENSSTLHDNFCPKRERKSPFKSENKMVDGTCFSCVRKDAPFDVSVNLCLNDRNLNHIKLPEMFTSQRSLYKDSLAEHKSDHSHLKQGFSEDQSNSSVNYLTESSDNTSSVNSSSVEDADYNLESTTPATSKENRKNFQNVDAHDFTNSTENTSSMNRRLKEVNNGNSTNTPHKQSKHFLNDSIIAASFLPNLSNYSVSGEYIFMVDRSGSMSGSHISNAKESLVLFLKSLPTSSYFNVVSFGSYSRSLFPCSQRYSQDSLEKGCVYVNSIKADMGGSELLQPLKAVLEKPHKPGYVRNVFVLTDGDVSQPDAIFKYLRTKCRKSRIFTFGIGPEISYNTVCSFARCTQGKAYFPEPGSKIQTKVVRCLKEVLKPTLCEIKADWQLPNDWQLTRACPEIPFSVSGQRMNLYAAVQLPSRAREKSTPRLGEKRKSSVKEFWFDEELDSCQLGDNMFFEDFRDDREFSGYWGTDTDISTSDYEQEYGIESDRNDIGRIKEQMVPKESGAQFIETVDSENTTDMGNDAVEYQSNVVKKWQEIRNARLYLSDTSTETEDESHGNRVNQSSEVHNNCLDLQNDTTLPDDLHQNHYVVESVKGLETSDDVANKLTHVTDTNTEDSLSIADGMICNNTDVLPKKAGISPHDVSNADCCHLSGNPVFDVIHNDVMRNDVRNIYTVNEDKLANQRKNNEPYTDYNISNREYNMNSNVNTNEPYKKSKENVIDCDNLQNADDSTGIEGSREFYESQDKTDSHCVWASVLITGNIGPDIHRERISVCLNSSLYTSNDITLHQMAAKKYIDDMEAILENMHENPGLEKEIADLSKESRVPSRMTSLMMVDDMGNVTSVSQNSVSPAVRHRQQLSRNPPKLTKREDYPPAILVSCPSVDEEPRSPTKRRLEVSAGADLLSDDDGKYYHIERLDPEGCDEVKQRSETSSRHDRNRLVDCRNIPVKAIQRRKLVSTRLTLLTRKMRNAHKLNVFAGPPFIRLILLQSAEGFWQLTHAFARIIGLPLVQLELAAPFADSTMIPLAEQDDKLGIDCYYDTLALWATALALVYLQRKWMSYEEDWELIATKSEAWLQRQTFPQGFAYVDVMLAAKQAIVLLEQKYRLRAKSEPIGLYNK